MKVACKLEGNAPCRSACGVLWGLGEENTRLPDLDEATNYRIVSVNKSLNDCQLASKSFRNFADGGKIWVAVFG